MTKKILLSLGAATALVGTSFAVVSCADSSESFKQIFNAEYNTTKFAASKTGFDESIDDYITYYNSDDNKDKLKEIFVDSKLNLDETWLGSISGPDFIDSIDLIKDGNDNVKFTLHVVDDSFSLARNEFVIEYASGNIVQPTVKNYVSLVDVDSVKFANLKSTIEGANPSGEDLVNSSIIEKFIKNDWSSDENQKKLINMLTLTQSLSTPESNENIIESVEVTNSSMNLDKNIKFKVNYKENKIGSNSIIEIKYFSGSLIDTIPQNITPTLFISEFNNLKDEKNVDEFITFYSNDENKEELNTMFKVDYQGILLPFEVVVSKYIVDTSEDNNDVLQFTLYLKNYGENRHNYPLVNNKFNIYFNDSKSFVDAPVSVTYDQKVFLDHKVPDINDFISSFNSADLEDKKTMFFATPSNAIKDIVASIDPTNPTQIIFSLIKNNGYELDQFVFVIDYSNGNQI